MLVCVRDWKTMAGHAEKTSWCQVDSDGHPDLGGRRQGRDGVREQKVEVGAMLQLRLG